MEKINWIAPEYIHTEKTSDWYWIVGIITISAATISIMLNNVIFAVLLLVSMFTLTLYASRKPQNIEIEINQKGVRHGDIYYPYADIKSFHVENKDKYPRIIFQLKKKLSSYVIILIKENDPEEIRDFLGNFLEEETHTEPFLAKLLIYFGF